MEIFRTEYTDQHKIGGYIHVSEKPLFSLLIYQYIYINQ